MVFDTELATNQIADAWQSPAVGIEAAGERAFAEQLEQALPLRVLQSRWPPSDGLGLECRQTVAVLLEVLGPLADSSATDTDFAGDLGLREFAFFEELASI